MVCVHIYPIRIADICMHVCAMHLCDHIAQGTPVNEDELLSKYAKFSGQDLSQVKVGHFVVAVSSFYSISNF